ncbi:MAG: iron ABC transporter permease [Oscillospiraceae bacterium]|nr:iron ABC transporter permease [Oscillospiraceae bacterium]
MKASGKHKVSALRIGTIWLILAALLVVLSLVAINVGSAGYSVSEIVHALFSPEKSTVKVVVMNLRLPRLILALLIGASLSSAGAILQSVMRNPLADPGTIGVSAGAGTAATTILLLFPHMTNAVPLFAFAGAALACFLIYTMAWKNGVDPTRIILSGVAINSVLGAYNALLQMLHSDSLEGVLAFMNGSLSGRSWSHVRVLVIYASLGLLLSFFCIKSANTLQLGEEMAKSLGVKVSLTRVLLSAVSAFLAAATVSVAGMIGFVGLVVPHIARILVGSDYKQMLPTSMLLGAVVLLAADTVGRTIVPGMEIPVGIVMSVTGGPFFLYLLRNGGKMRGNQR